MTKLERVSIKPFLPEEISTEIVDNVTRRIVELIGTEDPKLISRGLNIALMIRSAINDVFANVNLPN